MRPRVVDLPVSATEDRLVGTLDFEAALKQGDAAFHPGLLADANRAILYVDEVNLLDDHLVDTLLDAAAMGVNTVEREGVSVVHPARFILVGTMNPEEGELRPSCSTDSACASRSRRCATLNSASRSCGAQAIRGRSRRVRASGTDAESEL